MRINETLYLHWINTLNLHPHGNNISILTQIEDQKELDKTWIPYTRSMFRDNDINETLFQIFNERL